MTVHDRRASRPRGRERKTQLLEAALRLLASSGTAGISHRRVAAEAGVPMTATTYYFDSKDQLILEAFQLHADREAQRVASSLRVDDGPIDVPTVAARLAHFLHDGLTAARDNLIAEHELLAEAARRPELRELSGTWLDAVGLQLETILRELGSTEPAVDTRLVLATLAGLETDYLAVPTPPDATALQRILERLLGSLLQYRDQPDDAQSAESARKVATT